MQKDDCKEKRFRRRVSVVWKYFEKLSRIKVRCRLCGHEQNYQGTTGNIIRHLRTKHRIDATVKAKNQNEELENIKLEAEFNVMVKSEDTSARSHVFDLPQEAQDASIQRETYEEQHLDPYVEKVNEYNGYLNSPQEQRTNKEENYSQSQSQSFSKNKERKDLTAAEQRIIAEIDYFREKKEYYRMQTNLTALHAKKIKFELEQLV